MRITASTSRVIACVVILVALLRFGYVAVFRSSPRGPATIVTASGLKYIDLIEGQGATPQSGQTVTVHYKATLENGQEFDDTYKREGPPTFRLGVGLIEGWNEGVRTMKVGGKRRLVIPPYLGYGHVGRAPNIPPNATLIFDVELLGVN